MKTLVKSLPFCNAIKSVLERGSEYSTLHKCDLSQEGVDSMLIASLMLASTLKAAEVELRCLWLRENNTLTSGFICIQAQLGLTRHIRESMYSYDQMFKSINFSFILIF